MNISAPLRISYLRASTYIPPSSSGIDGPPVPQIPSLYDRRPTGTSTLSTFSALDYQDYKAKCQEAKTRLSVTSFDVPLTPLPPALEYSGPRERLTRMATVFPYTDISWAVAVIFFVTNALFLANSFFGFLPLVAPASKFDGEDTVAGPATLGIAATTFAIGIVMGLLAAFNVDRGELQLPGDSKFQRKLEEAQAITAASESTYRPALIGSSAFVWWPPSTELREIYLPNPAFQAGLVQLLGAAVFTVSNIASLPGVIQPSLKAALVFLPTAFGGLCFLAAALVLLFLAQERWYIPKFNDLNWHAYFWNSVGAFGFVLTGTLLLLGPDKNEVAASAATFVGRWGFLIGAFLQWYVLMEFYPST